MTDLCARIAGREHRLRYTVNALCDMEDLGGGLQSLSAKRFSSVRLLLWAALNGGGETVSVADTGDIMQKHIADGGTLEELSELCGEALRRCGFMA